MKAKCRTILSLFLCLLLLLGQTSFAAQKYRKEEVIYSKLDFNGENQLLIAVNGFPKGFKGEDYGDYSEITNLSNTDELISKSNKLSIDAKENFYYQGKLKTLELPWILSMKWTLDGKRVTEEELLGKSGLLGLEYEVKENPKVNQDFFQHYVLQTSFNFSVDQVGTITAPEGTLAVAGSSKLVNFMTLPGKGGVYTLEVEVRNYEPGMVQIAALPLNFSLDSMDFSEYTDDLKTLEMAIAQISGGTNQFVSGLGQVLSGANEFGAGGNEVVEGSKQLEGGLGELGAGSGSIEDGLEEYSKGMKDFSQGILLLTQGLDEVEKAIALLSDGGAQVQNGFQQYLQGIKEFSTYLEQAYQGSGELLSGVDKLGEGLLTLVEAGKGDGSPSGGEPDNLVDASAQFLQAFELLKVFENFELTEEQAEMILRTLEFVRDVLIPSITEIDQDKLLEIIAALENAHADLGSVMANLTMTRDALLSPSDYVPEEGEDPALVEKISAHYKGQMESRAAEITAELARLETIDESLVLQKEAAALFHQYFATLEASFNQFKGFLEEIQEILTAMELDKDKILGLNEQLKKLTRGYETFHQALIDYVNGVEQIYLSVAQKGSKETLLYGIKEMVKGLEEFDLAGKQLSSNGDKLNEGLEELSGGLQRLASEFSGFGEEKGKLESGVTELEKGAFLLYTNYKDFHRGLMEISSGMSEFTTGLGLYVHGFWGLADGLASLYAGGLELAGGANQLAQETSNMDEKMKEKILGYLDEFSGDNYEPMSFVDKRNKEVKSVHFVMLYEGKTIPLAEELEEEAQPTSFWDKLLNIFK